MVDPELIEILCCPQSHQGLTLADKQLVDELNGMISAGTLLNRADEKVVIPLQSCLVREDGAFCYPVRNDIPLMVIKDAIPLSKKGAN